MRNAALFRHVPDTCHKGDEVAHIGMIFTVMAMRRSTTHLLYLAACVGDLWFHDVMH